MIYAQTPIRTVAPAETPVTLAEVKAHLRVDSTDEDSLHQVYLDAAVAHLDGWSGHLGRCMVTQTWRQDFSDFPAGDELHLPFPDVSSVSVAYTDNNGDAQTLATSVYELVQGPRGSMLVLADNATWPNTDELTDAVQVAMVAGYGGASAVPSALKAAILLHVGSLNETRQMDSAGYTPTMAYEALVGPYRWVGI